MRVLGSSGLLAKEDTQTSREVSKVRHRYTSLVAFQLSHVQLRPTALFWGFIKRFCTDVAACRMFLLLNMEAALGSVCRGSVSSAEGAKVDVEASLEDTAGKVSGRRRNSKLEPPRATSQARLLGCNTLLASVLQAVLQAFFSCVL